MAEIDIGMSRDINAFIEGDTDIKNYSLMLERELWIRFLEIFSNNYSFYELENFILCINLKKSLSMQK